MSSHPSRRCWAEIDLQALSENIELLKQRVGSERTILAVVKANAYGHGLEEIADALLENRIKGFGVANVAEGMRVWEVAQRKGRDSTYIMVLSPVLPDEIEMAVDKGFICSVSAVSEIEAFDRCAGELGKVVQLHAVIDTGMGRMGAKPEELSRIATAILSSPNCSLGGLATHFPSADEDPEFTRHQIKQFRELVQQSGLSLSEIDIHLANSAGILDFSHEIEYATFARAGLAMYGVSPDCQNPLPIRPVFSLKSKVILVRTIDTGTPISYGGTFVAKTPMTVASIAAGYGDGYPRHVSGKEADVLIRGTRCAILGRVTMDQIVVDVSHLTTVEIGDEVVLVGSQENEVVSATEIASKADTIPWEILTGITPRVERVYLG